MSDPETFARRLRDAVPEEIEGAIPIALEHAVRAALQARRARRRGARVAVGVAAVAVAAGIAALGLPAASLRSAPVTIARAASSEPALTGDFVIEEPGAAAPGVTVRSGARAVMQLSADSRVELTHALVRTESFGKTSAFVLYEGQLRVEAAGDVEQVTVRAGAIAVEAQRAQVSVERIVGCAEPRVRVEQGQVAVRRGAERITLAAGGEWSGCVSATPAASGGKGAPVVTSSSLEEQNRALAVAVEARRAGQSDLAIVEYNQFLRRWPRGPLSEVARADRMNLLAERDPARARAAAREYLREHPRGPARARAQSLLEQGESP